MSNFSKIKNIQDSIRQHANSVNINNTAQLTQWYIIVNAFIHSTAKVTNFVFKVTGLQYVLYIDSL